uniref:Uncharacterized protein n=1 Tax=Clandestinovirus TaxID=2831644 RepID=A0A8F8KL72_9VIRU|nr:hypothetical protein KOM_12_465 [Clandestinovirus]
MDTLPRELISLVCKRMPTLENKKAISSSIPWIYRLVAKQTQKALDSHIAPINNPPMENIRYTHCTEYLPMSPGYLNIRGRPYQLFVTRTGHLQFISLENPAQDSYFVQKEPFIHGSEWVRIAIVLGTTLYVLVEDALNEANLHILKEASVYRQVMKMSNTANGPVSVDDIITTLRSEPTAQFLINLSIGTWYMVENIGELLASNPFIIYAYRKKCAPWGTDMNRVVTGCYSAFISDHTRKYKVVWECNVLTTEQFTTNHCYYLVIIWYSIFQTLNIRKKIDCWYTIAVQDAHAPHSYLLM